jgi:uncharacterized protein (PEP-CTERM system associated)
MKQKLVSFRRVAAAILAGAAALAAAPASAQTRIDVQPYVEARQGISVGLDSGDADAWTGLAAGIDISAQTRRVQGQISYRYERRFGWDDDDFDSDVHSGLAQVRAEVVPGMLNLNAGALATRARGDARGPIFGFSGFDDSNSVEVYSVYAGPDFSRRIGDIDVAASYRFGYVKVDDDGLDGLPIVPGQVLLDRYDSSTTHSATVSIGQGVGPLPFGWTIGAGYVREDQDRLDQEYEGKYVRADIVLPVTHTIALTAGVGYEHIESSLQDFLRDEAGLPVVTPGGNLIADPTRPRLVAFETDGVIYEGGIIWRPSRRTELQARIGHRYGGTTFTGLLRHQINGSWALNAIVYDTVDSFGRSVVTDLSGVPVNFNIPSSTFDPTLIGIGGCVFGTDPGTGTCFDEFFRSINSSNFRSRGASALLSGRRGLWTLGAGANYNHRKYFSPQFEDGIASARVVEETFSLTAAAERQLSPTSSFDVNAYAAWSDSGLAGIDEAYSLGASAGYRKRLYLERLEGFAAAGLFYSASDQFDSAVASLLAGVRYNF